MRYANAGPTLLRGFDDLRYITEDSFFVQIKSASITSIEFTREAVAWLHALELPFFVASVDRSAARLELYCAHRLSNAFITKHDRQTLTIFLDDQNTGDELVVEDDPDVHIGPPVLEWSLKSLTDDPSFVERFYKVTKAHIAIARNTLGARRAGWADSPCRKQPIPFGCVVAYLEIGRKRRPATPQN